jgi:carbonic anhydrase
MLKKSILMFMLGIAMVGSSFAEQKPGGAPAAKPVKEKYVPPAEAIKVPSSVQDPKDYAHDVKYLVVSCIDFRLRYELEKFMVLRVGPDMYDEIALPGASLGAATEEYPEWGITFLDTVDLSIKLHKIDTVVFIDHRGCGAYNLLKGEDCCIEKAKETQAHAAQFEVVRKLLKEKYPQLKVETLLMALDGQVETIVPKA